MRRAGAELHGDGLREPEREWELNLPRPREVFEGVMRELRKIFR